MARNKGETPKKVKPLSEPPKGAEYRCSGCGKVARVRWSRIHWTLQHDLEAVQGAPIWSASDDPEDDDYRIIKRGNGATQVWKKCGMFQRLPASMLKYSEVP